MNEPRVSSPSMLMNVCRFHADATRCSPFRTNFSLIAKTVISPVSECQGECSKEIDCDFVSRSKASGIYIISKETQCSGINRFVSATETTNTPFQMNLRLGLISNDTIVTTETYENDDISDMESVSEGDDTLYLCLPQSQLSSRSLAWTNEKDEIPLNARHLNFSSIVEKHSTRPQSSSLHKSSSPSEFSNNFCHRSKFRLSPKVVPRKGGIGPLLPSNPSEIPWNTRKRSLASMMNS